MPGIIELRSGATKEFQAGLRRSNSTVDCFSTPLALLLTTCRARGFHDEQSRFLLSALDKCGNERTMKAGRNDPCPCGSGKKYKKCCLPKDQLIPIDRKST